MAQSRRRADWVSWTIVLSAFSTVVAAGLGMMVLVLAFTAPWLGGLGATLSGWQLLGATLLLLGSLAAGCLLGAMIWVGFAILLMPLEAVKHYANQPFVLFLSPTLARWVKLIYRLRGVPSERSGAAMRTSRARREADLFRPTSP